MQFCNAFGCIIRQENIGILDGNAHGGGRHSILCTEIQMDVVIPGKSFYTVDTFSDILQKVCAVTDSFHIGIVAIDRSSICGNYGFVQ